MPIAKTVRRTAGVLCLVITGIALGTSLLPVDENACQEWQRRPFEFTPMTARTIRDLQERTPVYQPPATLSAAMFPGIFGGFALPGRVVIAARLDDAARGDLIRHELVHVEQLRRHGVGSFTFTYAADWFRGRWHGCGVFDSYEAIRYEREADLYAAALVVVEWAESGPSMRAYAERFLGPDLLPADAGLPRVPLASIARRIVELGYF